MLTQAVARAWAVGTGRAEEIDGKLHYTGEVDAVGLSVIAVGNSEESEEDFARFYSLVAEAIRGSVTLSQDVLEAMVEAATIEFGSSAEHLAA